MSVPLVLLRVVQLGTELLFIKVLVLLDRRI